MVLAIGSGEPQKDIEQAVQRVSYERPSPAGRADGYSGYTVWFDGAPGDRDVAQEDCWILCMHCLIDHHPEARAGMEIARRGGAAVLDEGSWVVAPEQASGPSCPNPRTSDD